MHNLYSDHGVKQTICHYAFKGDIQLADGKDAILFLTTEVAELIDAEMRQDPKWVRNNAKEVSKENAVADVLMMLYAYCIEEGINPLDALHKKLERKLKEQ